MNEFGIKFIGNKNINTNEMRDRLKQNTSICFDIEQASNNNLDIYCKSLITKDKDGYIGYIQPSQEDIFYLFYSSGVNTYALVNICAYLVESGFEMERSFSKSAQSLAVPWNKLSRYNQLKYSTFLYRIL